MDLQALGKIYRICLCKCLFLLIYLAAQGVSCDMWDLVPQPGIKPGPPALGAKGLNHWTTREVPDSTSFKKYLLSAYYMLKTLRISELTKKISALLELVF